MTDVTPLGIITDKVEESCAFYKNVMGIERVVRLGSKLTEGASDTVLKLESPDIEVISTQLRIGDRSVNRMIRRDHRLILRPRDLGSLLNKLSKLGIEPASNPSGGMMFEDINGINWELRINRASWLQPEKTGFPGNRPGETSFLSNRCN